MGYRALRVINEDIIGPGTGFPTHGHADMEIITYLISGVLEHKDSTGEHEQIKRGEVQRMTAGRGIRHSEANPSASEEVKLLQIWMLPEAEGLEPGYEQKAFPEEVKRNRLCPIAARDGRDGALHIHQDLVLYASCLDHGKAVTLPLAAGRGAWLQMVSGQVSLEGQILSAGDGAAVQDVAELVIEAQQDSEFLLFDMA